jgi:hypothetical protein
VSEEQVPTKRTAAQRIDDLENALMSSFQTLEQLARENQIIKEAVKLLGSKVDAIVQATSSGIAITNESLSSIMVQNTVADLESKVNNLKDQGILVAEETVTETSFVVGRELDTDGTVVNPRLQFALSAVKAELKSTISGAKVGDVLVLEEGKLNFEVLETYAIRSPAQPEPQVEA